MEEFKSKQQSTQLMNMHAKKKKKNEWMNEPSLLVWAGGCKVEIVFRNVSVCAPLIKIEEGMC